MPQYFTVLLTAIVTFTTIVYTFYSIRLWKTSRQSAEIARQAALAALWSELNKYIEVCAKQNLPETPFLRELSGVFAEYMLATLFDEVNAKQDRHVTEFKNKIEALIETRKIDAATIAWLSPFTNKKK